MEATVTGSKSFNVQSSFQLLFKQFLNPAQIFEGQVGEFLYLESTKIITTLRRV